MAIDNESGDFVRPLPQFLDNLIVAHPELGQTELWKVIAWETSKLRNYIHRADSAAAIGEAVARGSPSSKPKRAPPLVADEVDDPMIERIQAAISDLEARLDAFEERKAEEAVRRERCETALRIAEELAETDPAKLDALLPAQKERLH